MDRSEILGAIEAILFASGEPVPTKSLCQILERLWAEVPEEERKARLAEVPSMMAELEARWTPNGVPRGFRLLQVAEGWTFRSDPRFADALRAMREARPVRLSKAALETLAIIAYRQPVTKPEIDHIRGVDCGGTIRILLDRNLIRIMGKRDEPGRPLLYGTSKEFLSFFNLRSLSHLPTLREFHELSEEAQEELAKHDFSLEDLKEVAKKVRLDTEPSLDQLDEALEELKQKEHAARAALAEEGIALQDDSDVAASPASPVAPAPEAPSDEAVEPPRAASGAGD